MIRARRIRPDATEMDPVALYDQHVLAVSMAEPCETLHIRRSRLSPLAIVLTVSIVCVTAVAQNLGSASEPSSRPRALDGSVLISPFTDADGSMRMP